MSTQIAPATIADLERHPGRCELINGEIVEMSPSGHGQGFVSANIASALIVHVRATKQGCQVLTNDPGFILDDQNVRAPDVAVISFEQVKAAPQRGYMRFVPRLAVEVVSPGDEWSEVKAKANGIHLPPAKCTNGASRSRGRERPGLRFCADLTSCRQSRS